MPRKAEPSFELKTIIWDIAATVGSDKCTDIQRQLGYELEKRRQKGSFFENEPDVRTISRIVNEVNTLTPEIVITKLPAHVWKLRNDYEAIKQLAKAKQTTPAPEQPRRAIEHDVAIFEKSDAIATERKFEWLKNLLKSGCFYSSQLDEVLQFMRFFGFESNKYVDSRLKYLCYVFCAKLEELCEFIQIYSSEIEWWGEIVKKADTSQFNFNDEWHRLIREAQEQSELHLNNIVNGIIGLDSQKYLVSFFTPDIQSAYDDLIRRGDLDSDDIHNLESQYIEWNRNFNKLIDDTWTTYLEYRAAVRDTLFL